MLAREDAQRRARAAARRATPPEPSSTTNAPAPRSLGTTPPVSFFRRPALELAPDLLGLILAHETPEGLVAGRIVEVEAYCGPDDLAAHSARGRRTARNEVMYGEGGVAYVYFIYGMHWCVNVVAATRDVPEAVLLRALEPVHGLELMRARRGARVPDAALARGPGNLTKALGIDRSLNGADLRTSALRIYRPRCGLPDRSDVVRSRRIGVDYAGPWAELPWRFSLRGNPSVSRPPRSE
ncbi:MAG TPA: DNA-3-methyladenine glycosylase [Candidatus Binatia bacterium]